MEKILFADDDVEIQEVVKSILTRAGYDTVIAKDGAEALRLAEETKWQGGGHGAFVT